MATFQGVIIWEAHSHWSFMIWHNSKHQTSEKSVTRMAAQWFHHIIYIHINVCILLYNAHLYIFVVSHYLSVWRKYGQAHNRPMDNSRATLFSNQTIGFRPCFLYRDGPDGNGLWLEKLWHWSVRLSAFPRSVQWPGWAGKPRWNGEITSLRV